MKGFVLSSRKLSALPPISSHLCLEREGRPKITTNITVLNVLIIGPGASLGGCIIAHSVVVPERLDENKVFGLCAWAQLISIPVLIVGSQDIRFSPAMRQYIKFCSPFCDCWLFDCYTTNICFLALSTVILEIALTD